MSPERAGREEQESPPESARYSSCPRQRALLRERGRKIAICAILGHIHSTNNLRGRLELALILNCNGGAFVLRFISPGDLLVLYLPRQLRLSFLRGARAC